jgi:hypothetical protein
MLKWKAFWNIIYNKLNKFRLPFSGGLFVYFKLKVYRTGCSDILMLEAKYEEEHTHDY